MTITFGEDPVRVRVKELLDELEAGSVVDHRHEGVHVDLKEDVSRRDRHGAPIAGDARSEAAAKYLASEAACMANTPGGGALIVGVGDAGDLLGTGLDSEWLRHRIYELTDRKLTVDTSEALIRGTRLLVVISPQAMEPVRYHRKIRWRVDDRCEEVDPNTWFTRQWQHLRYDWSAAPSTVGISEVRPAAVEIARSFLYESGEDRAQELAAAETPQMLRMLNVVGDGDVLTNAGVLAFVGREANALDYTHHDVAGGDSTARVNRRNRSLLEELAEVFQVFEANNATRHVHTGLVVGQVRDIPVLAAREAIVNGVAHREWGNHAATRVEHIGRTLRVTSPGGFHGGVNESNIITHPSASRNVALTQLLADLRVAERQGVGVDRMVREMIRHGHRRPTIHEIEGPYVRVSLLGDTLDEPWMSWLGRLDPRREGQDVSSLLILDHLVEAWWIDDTSAADLIQLAVEEAGAVLQRLAGVRIEGQPLVEPVVGAPVDAVPAWSLTAQAREVLSRLDAEAGFVRTTRSRSEVATSYARRRGRISTAELASIVNGQASNMGSTLKPLEADGLLEPSNASRRGRGFYYRWVG